MLGSGYGTLALYVLAGIAYIALSVVFPKAILSWVEDGKAPDTILATRRDQSGAVTRSRPLCQYPQVAKYKGSGSTDDAANFSCSAGF